MNRLYAQPIIWLTAAFVILGMIYAWATPPFEASDEYWHFGMVEYIVQNHALPVQDPDMSETLWRQEGSQPPLYYVLAAAVLSPFDLGEIDRHRVLNPHVRAGQPGTTHNKNFVLHDGVGRFDSQAIRAVYGVRLLGVVFGAVTVLAVYACTRLLKPGAPSLAVLAAGMVAFNPMFLFISASINNDTLVTALASVAIYLLLRMLRDGFETPCSVLLAVFIALATLTKLSGLVLVPVVAGAALWAAYRDRNWRGLIVLGVLMAGTWAVLAGWWYARNLQLYDELFGTAMMVRIAGVREGAFALGVALDEFKGFRWAFWGILGVFDVLVPIAAFYWLLDGLSLLAAVGLTWVLWRRIVRRDGDVSLAALLALTAIVGIGFVAFLQWTAQTYASQGRLLFPYNAAIMPLMAVGLAETLRVIFPLRYVREATFARIPLVLVGALGITAVLIPFAVIAPVYRVPQAQGALSQTATPVYARFGDVELIGYEAADQRYVPGDAVEVTLYWRVAVPSVQDNSLYLTFLTPDGDEIGKIDTYPGGGRLRTSVWQAGAIYADSYQIDLSREVVGQFPLRLHVGWWHYPTGESIASHDENGQPIDSVMLDAGAFVSPGIAPDVTGFIDISPVMFGGAIRLIGYHFDDETGTLQLHWESARGLDDTYTVFAQALDESNGVVGQGDAPPLLPTRYWRPGEQFVTQHMLPPVQSLPDGVYRVVVGWYRPGDFIRLETDHPDNAYVVLEMES